MEYGLEVVYSHRLLRVEDDKIVAIALVVAEEEILAVLRAILAPILSSYLDGGCFGVFVPRILYVVARKPFKYFVASIHSKVSYSYCCITFSLRWQS